MNADIKPVPARLFRGWLVVAAAFSVLFLAYGLQFSYGVFVSGMTDEQLRQLISDAPAED